MYWTGAMRPSENTPSKSFGKLDYRTVVADLFVKVRATCNPWPPDTTLTPPGTQYRATPSKLEKRNQPRYAGFASFCKLLQHPTDHS